MKSRQLSTFTDFLALRSAQQLTLMRRDHLSAEDVSVFTRNKKDRLKRRSFLLIGQNVQDRF